ncbi:hypothetical protein Tco_0580652 [Tanacetum coccineum]
MKSLRQNAVKNLRQNAVKSLRQNAVKSLRQNAVKNLRQNAVKKLRQNAVKKLRQNAVKKKILPETSYDLENLQILSGESKVHIEVLSVLWENRLSIPDGSLSLSRYKGLKTKQKQEFSGSMRSSLLIIRDQDEVGKIPRALQWKEHESTNPKVAHPTISHAPPLFYLMANEIMTRGIAFIKSISGKGQVNGMRSFNANEKYTWRHWSGGSGYLHLVSTRN